MTAGTWIAIYMPMIVLLLVIIPYQRKYAVVNKMKMKKKGVAKMSNELIKNSVGRKCNIVGGSMGSNILKAEIVEVIDNWMKVKAKGKEHLVNIEFIQSILFLD